MHHPTDRITHTTAFVTPVVEHWLEREIAQWVHPMKDRFDDPPHHERTLYLWATSRSSLFWSTESRGRTMHDVFRAGCSSLVEWRIMVRWTHCSISRSSQCSTTGVRKAVVCTTSLYKIFLALDRQVMVWWVVESKSPGEPIVLFLVPQPVLHNLCFKGRVMYYHSVGCCI